MVFILVHRKNWNNPQDHRERGCQGPVLGLFQQVDFPSWGPHKGISCKLYQSSKNIKMITMTDWLKNFMVMVITMDLTNVCIQNNKTEVFADMLKVNKKFIRFM